MTVDFAHKKGDTFYAVPFEVDKNGVPMSLTGVKIEFIMYKEFGGQPVLAFSSIGSGLTITDAATGKFQIDKQIIDRPAFNYVYKIVFTFSAGTVIKTYLTGNFLITDN